MNINDILKEIKKENFNDYDYSFEYEQASNYNPMNIHFENEDGYIILDEDNDSTCIEYDLEYDRSVSHCDGDNDTPPSSDYYDEITLTIRVLDNGSLMSLNAEDEELIKERISNIITVE